MNLVIPMMPERLENALDLLTVLELEVPWSKGVKIFSAQGRAEDIPDALEYAHGPGPSPDWVLWLEDDIELGPDFNLIPDLLLGVPNNTALASFFSLYDKPEGWHRFPPAKWYMTQAIALRGDLVAGFRPFFDRWCEENPTHILPTDTCLGAYTKELGMDINVFFPSLVQHLPLPSTIKGRSKARQSPTFGRRVQRAST